jgi:hypothetical protein
VAAHNAPLWVTLDLDWQGGLKYFGFDEQGYLEMLCSYYGATGNLLAGLPEPNRANLGRYAQVLAAIGEFSAGICATALGQKAAQLERAARAGDVATVRELHEPFVARVKALLGQIRVVVDKVERSATKLVTRAPSSELLADLCDCCRNGDANAARAVLHELEGNIYQTGGGLVTWLGSQLDKRDLASIVQRLQGLQQGNTQSLAPC